MLFQKGQQFSAERGNVVLLNIETGARKLRQTGQKILQRQEIFPVLPIDQAVPKGEDCVGRIEFRQRLDFHFQALRFSQQTHVPAQNGVCLAPDLFTGTVEINQHRIVFQDRKKLLEFRAAKRDPAQRRESLRVGIVLVCKVIAAVFLYPGEDEVEQLLGKRVKGLRRMEKVQLFAVGMFVAGLYVPGELEHILEHIFGIHTDFEADLGMVFGAQEMRFQRDLSIRNGLHQGSGSLYPLASEQILDDRCCLSGTVFGEKAAVLVTDIIGEPAHVAGGSRCIYIIKDRLLHVLLLFIGKEHGGAVLTDTVIAVEGGAVTVTLRHVIEKGIVGKGYFIFLSAAALYGGFDGDFLILAVGFKGQNFVLFE